LVFAGVKSPHTAALMPCADGTEMPINPFCRRTSNSHPTHTSVKPRSSKKRSPKSASVTGSSAPPRVNPVNTGLRPRFSTSTSVMPFAFAGSLGLMM
jgi:hypothetical protein